MEGVDDDGEGRGGVAYYLEREEVEEEGGGGRNNAVDVFPEREVLELV